MRLIAVVRFVEPSFFSCGGYVPSFPLGYACCQPEFSIQQKKSSLVSRFHAYLACPLAMLLTESSGNPRSRIFANMLCNAA